MSSSSCAHLPTIRSGRLTPEDRRATEAPAVSASPSIEAGAPESVSRRHGLPSWAPSSIRRTRASPTAYTFAVENPTYAEYTFTGAGRSAATDLSIYGPMSGTRPVANVEFKAGGFSEREAMTPPIRRTSPSCWWRGSTPPSGSISSSGPPPDAVQGRRDAPGRIRDLVRAGGLETMGQVEPDHRASTRGLSEATRGPPLRARSASVLRARGASWIERPSARAELPEGVCDGTSHERRPAPFMGATHRLAQIPLRFGDFAHTHRASGPPRSVAGSTPVFRQDLHATTNDVRVNQWTDLRAAGSPMEWSLSR